MQQGAKNSVRTEDGPVALYVRWQQAHVLYRLNTRAPDAPRCPQCMYLYVFCILLYTSPVVGGRDNMLVLHQYCCCTGSLFVLVPDGCGGIAEGYRRGAARTAELIQHYMQRTLYVFVLLVSASVVCSAYLATVAGLLTFRAEQIFNIFCFLGENGVATR